MWMHPAATASAAPALEEKFERSYSVPDDVSLTVRNRAGTIYIYGAKSGELKIFARKRAYAQARLEAIAINVVVEGGKASIETKFPPSPEGLSLVDRSGSVEYIILAPERCRVELAEVETGELIVQDLRGAGVTARLTNGRIIARDCFCEVNLKVSAGRIDAYYNWWEAARFDFAAELGDGHLRLNLPTAAALMLEANCAQGKARLAVAGDSSGARQGKELKLQIGDSDGVDFKLRVANGNIDILKGF